MILSISNWYESDDEEHCFQEKKKTIGRDEADHAIANDACVCAEERGGL